MKDKLTGIDALLAQMLVSGDNVLILAAARSALRRVIAEMEADNVPTTDRV